MRCVSGIFDSMDAQSFGGNVADYKERVNAMNGVAGVRYIRYGTAAGRGRFVIINSEFNVPSAELVGQVQTAVDPVQKTAGEGSVSHRLDMWLLCKA